MKSGEIKKIIEELLSRMNFETEKIDVLGSESEPKFSILLKDARLLIGKNGETFSSFVHVLRKMVEQKLHSTEKIVFSVDVNGYQAEKVKETLAKIQILLDRARTLQTEVELPPMPSYERLMVHEALNNVPDVATESRGEGPLRHVVIKYIKQKESL